MDRYGHRHRRQHGRRTYRRHRSPNYWDVNETIPSGTKRKRRESVDRHGKIKKIDNSKNVSNETIDLTTEANEVKETEQKNKIKEKCPICFYPFKYQQVCTPDTCNHSFCVKCLERWAACTNTCPIDRQQFTSILVREHVGGPTIQEIELNIAVCDLCGKNDRDEGLMTCETCLTSYHLFCLSISNFSEGPEWLCADCGMDRLVTRIEID